MQGKRRTVSPSAEHASKRDGGGAVKIAQDGIKEESLIVNSEHIHGFSHENGYVEAEAVVKIVDIAGQSWVGSAQVRIPVARRSKEETR